MKKEDFAAPEKVRGLQEAQVPLWFWNDRLEKDELKRQLSLMTQKGVSCCAPHARTGYEGTYLGDDWMGYVGAVLDYKRARGETMWLYDEFNWPAGIADGRVTADEKYREKYLLILRFDVPAGTRFRCQPVQLRCRKKDENDKAKAVTTDIKGKIRIDSLYCYDAKTLGRLDITQFQPDDGSGQLFNLAESDFEVLRDRDTIVYQAKVCTERFAGEGFYDPDYLNSAATEKFVDITYEAYFKRFSGDFGSTITASFNDETRFCHAFPWTDDLLEKFEERYGYCLEERIPDLVLPGTKAGRTRCDYFNLIADLYRENYHGVIRSWCEEHHIDYCPHLLGEETLAGQVRYSGDYLRQIRETTRPGVDHLGRGIGSLNVRFASSAAEVYGKKGLACETFAASGWELTFEDYIRMISWLYAQGVETVVNHGFFYSIRDFRKDDWPPSQFFQWEGWEKMDRANAMCRRLYGMVHEGRRKTDLLIYHPVETYWLHYLADQNFTHGYHLGPFIRDDTAAKLDRDEQILLNTLQEKNQDFTVFPSDAADLFKEEDGALVNVCTGQTYHSFILPMCEVLPLKTAKLLLGFVKCGGRLAILEKIPCFGERKEEDEELNTVMEAILASPQTALFGVDREDSSCMDSSDAGSTGDGDMGRNAGSNDRGCSDSRKNPEDDKKETDRNTLSALLTWLNDKVPQDLTILEGRCTLTKTQDHYPEWLIDPYIHTGEDMDGISFTKFVREEGPFWYLVNYTDKEEELIAEVTSEESPEIWDPLTGKISKAEVILKREAGKMERKEEKSRESKEGMKKETKEEMGEIKEGRKETEKAETGQIYRIRLALPKGYGVFLVTALQ